VDFTIVHKVAVGDRKTIDFTESFYSTIFQGMYLGGSLISAKNDSSEGYQLHVHKNLRGFYLVRENEGNEGQCNKRKWGNEERLASSGSASINGGSAGHGGRGEEHFPKRQRSYLGSEGNASRSVHGAGGVSMGVDISIEGTPSGIQSVYMQHGVAEGGVGKSARAHDDADEISSFKSSAKKSKVEIGETPRQGFDGTVADSIFVGF